MWDVPCCCFHIRREKVLSISYHLFHSIPDGTMLFIHLVQIYAFLLPLGFGALSHEGFWGILGAKYIFFRNAVFWYISHISLG